MKLPGKSHPTPFQTATCWAALTGLSLTFIILLIAALLYGFCRVFVALEPVLLPVVIAGILAYLLSPIVNWVQKHAIKKRVLAVLCVLSAGGLVVCGFIATIVPRLVDQAGELYAQRQDILQSCITTSNDLLENNKMVQSAVDMLYEKTVRNAHENGLPADAEAAPPPPGDYPGKLTAILNYNSGYLTEQFVKWLTAGTRALSGVTFFLVGVIMVPVFLFYFLLESEPIARNWHTILPLRRSFFRNEVVATLQQINNYIISFVRGQMLVSVVDGILLGIALKILGLPYAITIGAAAAVLGIIPYIGMISTSIPAMVIAWFTWTDLNYVLAVAAIFVCISQFDGWVIQPRIVGNRVGMHDLTVMFSVLFWSLVLGGVVGALLAVPLTASIKVLFMRYVWPSLSPGTRRRQRSEQSAALPPESGPEPPGTAAAS